MGVIQQAIAAIKSQKFLSQVDYVDMIDRLTSYKRLTLLKISSTEFKLICTSGDKGRHETFHFMKDTNDDFFRVFNTILGGPFQFDYDNADTRTGTWATSGTNWYASAVGSTFTCHAKGNCIKFKHFSDNRGGVWQIAVDGGAPVNISTWAASGTSLTDTIIASGLDETIDHVVIGTFTGDDPSHVPSGGAGTSRGWVRYNASDPTDSSIMGYIIDADNNFEPVYAGSNIEFAFNATYSGQTNWIPEHNSTGTLFNAELPVFYVDGLVFDYASLTAYGTVDCSHFALSQHMYARFPVAPATNLAEVWMIHGVGKDGICNVTACFKELQPATIVDGYTFMMSLKNGVVEEVVTGIGNSHINAKDGSNYWFTEEGDRVYSCAGIDVNRPHIVTAYTIDYPLKSLRQGANGKPTIPLSAVQGASNYMKVYNAVFKNYTMPQNEVFQWSGRVTSAVIPNAYQLFKG